ncbi:putative phytoene desaturase / phytofluene desaturase / zeta-carotene desaturase [Gordonia terrae C-6]|uniref:Putative phytoene desaturase / phytofluene desaturase / zeta-carotene desaturase n=1 Tax=Gordonia terrae C-6 TaxID=1316928 RepID=R7Y829_9ACTN|nr:phytoene desaturase family protein [Gordonia terrae]EON32196.1 putative phytoene desaturase / phytofluene desaturase / zeta-carotene desaturase [Gordonia terrae C-6]
MTRVLVIGAGVGGLSVAMRLAATGHDVTVLEQFDDIGGKLGVIERDGFVFDTGPSLVTMPHVFEELFAATGSSIHDHLTLERLPVAARYRFPDGTCLDMPGHLDDIPAALDAALGPGRGTEWSTFLQRAERVWDVTHEPFLESPMSIRTMIGGIATPSDVRAVAPWQSLRGLGERYLDDPRLRMLLDRYATYTGSDPRRAPAALASVPWSEQAFGSWYVRGGLGRIASAMRDRLGELGGRVELGVEVDRISLGPNGRADGVVLTDGSRRSADLVVANADARQVYNRLVPRRAARRPAALLRRTTPSLSGFVLLLALDDPPPQPHHQVLFAEDYDEEFDAVFGFRGPPRPAARPTVYISAPADPAIVPGPRTGAWFVLVNAPRHDPDHGVDWDTEGLADAYADQILEVMADRGLDLAGHVRHRLIVSPADLERRTRTPGGSIYGSSSNAPRSAFLRPSNTSPVPGLYLVGGSSHPGGGLPLVVMSAKIVADLIGPAPERH